MSIHKSLFSFFTLNIPMYLLLPFVKDFLDF